MVVGGSKRLSASTGFKPERECPEKFAFWVLEAIGKGSTYESPFLHTTRELQVAIKWQRLGRLARKDYGNYLIRINRFAIDPECVVDMSTKVRPNPES